MGHPEGSVPKLGEPSALAGAFKFIVTVKHQTMHIPNLYTGDLINR